MLVGGYNIEINYLREDSAISEWFTLINPRPTTEMNYLRGIKIYSDFCGMPPAKLKEEAVDEEENGITKRRRKIKKHLFDYIEFLNKSNTSPLTIKTRLSVIISFYNSLEIELPSLPRSKNSVTCLEKNLAIPTKNDLVETLNACENELIIFFNVQDFCSVSRY